MKGQEATNSLGSSGSLTIKLLGPFSLLGPDGQDLTPTSKRARGLLALLACSPGFRRSRELLQDKLWSTRDQIQGGQSLRQELATIRKVLKPYEFILKSKAGDLWLDAQYVSVDLDWQDEGSWEHDPLETHVFLEGIAVSDPEFEDWLRQCRQRLWNYCEKKQQQSGNKLTPTQPTLVICDQEPQDKNSAIEPSSLANSLQNHFGFALKSVDERDFERMRSSALDGHFLVSTKAQARSQVIDFHYPKTQRSELLELKPNMLDGVAVDAAIAFHTNVFLDRLLNKLPALTEEVWAANGEASKLNPVWWGLHLVCECLKDGGRNALSASENLAKVFEDSKQPVFLAWASYLLTFVIGEREKVDVLATIEKAEEYARRALMMEANNPVSLSLLSHVSSYLLEDPFTGYELAKRCLKVDNQNALGWTFLGEASLYLGRPKEASRYLKTARDVQGLGMHHSMINGLSGFSALASGDLPSALSIGRTLEMLNPNFKAAKRNLVATHVLLGNNKEAEQLIISIKAVDPTYSLAELTRTKLVKESWSQDQIQHFNKKLIKSLA